ncbi:MAG: bis(5'-nucleosyl)-tetraphosphatase (symmetrical) YqeK [Clostridia bacterium]|nr:bis(5'-nucleosyl)-tetraphosphatase (symmetrical) YqeK [Clostridia bacterium]
MRRVGVILDDFDPFRFDHLNLANAAKEAHGLEKLIFVPLPLPEKKEKSQNHARIDQRYRMCMIGLMGQNSMEMIPYGLVYQAESALSLIRKIRRAYTDAKCFFILSAQALLRLASQPQFKGVRDSAFICWRTPDFKADDILSALMREGLDISVADVPGGLMADRDCRRQIAALVDPDWMDRREIAYIASEGAYLPDGKKQLKKMLTTHRWEHSLGVQQVSIRLALTYGGNILKVSQAALYHDCAKCMTVKEMRRIAEAHHLTASAEVLHSGALLHGPVGAVIAKEQFSVTDAEVLDAIRFHTTGRENMTLTDLIVFVADAIEPNREDYDGLERIRALSRVSLRDAALCSLYTTKKFVSSRGREYDEQGLKTIAWLEGTLNEQEKEWMKDIAKPI